VSGTGRAGTAPSARSRAASRRSTWARVTKRPGRVVHQHGLVAHRGQRRQPRLHGIGPGFSTGDGAPADQAAQSFVDLAQPVAGHDDHDLAGAGPTTDPPPTSG